MKRFLVDVDMQNDFVDGALGSKEAVAAVPTSIRQASATQSIFFRAVFMRDPSVNNNSVSFYNTAPEIASGNRRKTRPFVRRKT